MLLNSEEKEALGEYLQRRKWLQPGETLISATKPGEGNMNYLLRINTGKRTFIVKQARPYVEKYPKVSAPVERAEVEALFYATVQHNEILKSYTPLLLATDVTNNVLVLEDLGEASDFTYLYNRTSALAATEAIALTSFLNELHKKGSVSRDPLLANKKMKALNHEHIFIYPYMTDNGLDLDKITPGLQEVSMKYKSDSKLKEKLTSLGQIYLDEGASLLHGDYYPGSWLKTAKGIKIIDPEFCFYGPPQFDLAVMLAHCRMSAQPEEIINTIHNTYKKNNDFNETLLEQFKGAEIMRRLIGLAQLPLNANLEEKEKLLEKSYAFIMQ